MANASRKAATPRQPTLAKDNGAAIAAFMNASKDSAITSGEVANICTAHARACAQSLSSANDAWMHIGTELADDINRTLSDAVALVQALGQCRSPKDIGNWQKKMMSTFSDDCYHVAAAFYSKCYQEACAFIEPVHQQSIESVRKYCDLASGKCASNMRFSGLCVD